MADTSNGYTRIYEPDHFEQISSNPLDEAILPSEETHQPPSVCSSTHGPFSDEYTTRVKDLPSKVEAMLPTCAFLETTENIIVFIWGAFILFLGVIFVVAQFNTHLKIYSFTSTYWILSTFMLIAIFAMGVAIFNRKNKQFIVDKESNDDTEDYATEGDTRYLIVNAYIFSIGNFLLDMFAILTVLHCGLGEGAISQRPKYTAMMAYHVIRILFSALQLSFFQIFMKEKIRRLYQLPYKLLVAHVMVTHFNVWFTFLCQQTGIMNRSAYEAEGEYDILNCTSSPNDGVFQTAKYATTYLTPFILEYSLLSASMFYSLFPSKSVIDDEPDHRRKYNYGAIDRVKRDKSKIYRSHPALLVGIIVGLLLVLSSWTLSDNRHSIYNLRFSYGMQTIFHVLMMFASFMVIREMRTYHAKRFETLKYRVDDYLLLLTGIGGFLPFLFMVLFSVFKVKDKDYASKKWINKDAYILKNLVEKRALLCVVAIANVISVIVQTLVLLTAHSYKRLPFSFQPTDSSVDLIDMKGHYTKLRSSARIGQWLIFLLLLNLSMWIVTSTFEIDSGLRETYMIPSVYWSRRVWLFISQLLYPILIFYRIHSVAMIAVIWMSFRINKKKVI